MTRSHLSLLLIIVLLQLAAVIDQVTSVGERMARLGSNSHQAVMLAGAQPRRLALDNSFNFQTGVVFDDIPIFQSFGDVRLQP